LKVHVSFWGRRSQKSPQCGWRSACVTVRLNPRGSPLSPSRAAERSSSISTAFALETDCRVAAGGGVSERGYRVPSWQCRKPMTSCVTRGLSQDCCRSSACLTHPLRSSNSAVDPPRSRLWRDEKQCESRARQRPETRAYRFVTPSPYATKRGHHSAHFDGASMPISCQSGFLSAQTAFARGSPSRPRPGRARGGPARSNSRPGAREHRRAAEGEGRRGSRRDVDPGQGPRGLQDCERRATGIGEVTRTSNHPGAAHPAPADGEGMPGMTLRATPDVIATWIQEPPSSDVFTDKRGAIGV
jgi:hypothetical protein